MFALVERSCGDGPDPPMVFALSEQARRGG
jgi:hypothetical protein